MMNRLLVLTHYNKPTHHLSEKPSSGHISVSRTVNEWKRLSTDCVNASSMNVFENEIDKYLSFLPFVSQVNRFN